MYRKYFKRLFDIIFSFVSLVLLSPVLLAVAWTVRVKLGSPVIFKQPRPGKDEKIFTLYKFRTMTDERDENGNLLPDGERLTPLGRFLRSTSMDELPELWNILKGEMSIVGPRPLLVKDMVFMTKEQRMRHSVRPGLTGWAQVNGRNNVTWEEKLDLDLEYLKRVTFLNDIKIIIMTLIKVLKGSGVNTDGMDTAEDLGDYLLRRGWASKEEYLKKINENKSIIKSFYE